MDTEFWGPSGHRLFHLVTYRFDDDFSKHSERSERLLRRFFKSVGHVLPCIYCRRSFQQYSRDLPLQPFAEKGKSFEWYYRVHNLINRKLRKQGYLHTPDPSYRSVLSRYRKLARSPRPCFVGWDFLYSICYNFPVHYSEMSARRLRAHVTFFNLLAKVYPFERLRVKYEKYLQRYPIENALTSTLSLVKWLYRFEKSMNPVCCSFKNKCSRLDRYKVKKCANKSCRKK